MEKSKPPRARDGTERLKPYRFVPGVSGNPGGRPRKQLVSGSLARQVEEALPDDVARAAGLPVGSTWADLLAKNLLRKAAKGDLQATREILDRIEGKAEQRHHVTGEGDDPVEVNISARALLKAKFDLVD